MKPWRVCAYLGLLGLLVAISGEDASATNHCDPYDELKCNPQASRYDRVNCRCVPLAPAVDLLQDIVKTIRYDSRFGQFVGGSAGQDLNWSPVWELRWAEFQLVDGRRVRLWHAASKVDRSLHYTIFLDPDFRRWSGWTRVPAS